MKNYLILIMLLLVIMMVGCKENQEMVIEPIEEDSIDMSFEERTKEAKYFLAQDNGYGIPSYWGNKSSQQHFIESASLEKKDSYYIMKLQFYSPIVFDKEEIENAYDLAQHEGMHTYNDFTFYKDNKVKELNEIIKSRIENLPSDSILATINDGLISIYIFRLTPNNNKYYVTFETVNYGTMLFDYEKEIEVVLLPNDKITITFDRDLNEEIGKELSVDEYYQKAINNEVSLEDSIYGFEYSISSVGNSHEAWGITNAVTFDNNRINVNF